MKNILVVEKPGYGDMITKLLTANPEWGQDVNVILVNTKAEVLERVAANEPPVDMMLLSAVDMPLEEKIAIVKAVRNAGSNIPALLREATASKAAKVKLSLLQGDNTLSPFDGPVGNITDWVREKLFTSTSAAKGAQL